MADIIALEQGAEGTYPFWHFFDADNCRRYWFNVPVTTDPDPGGWLQCKVYCLPQPGDKKHVWEMMTEFLVMCDEDALCLLQAFRRRCGLDPIPDRVFE